MIHWIWLKEAPSFCRIDGIAMLTMVTSTRSMNAAVITIARAYQRRRSPAAGAAGDGSGVCVEIMAVKL
ncbi:hypothetical protein GCM10010279_34660 [Streptomyces mutabilis]|nr:hypothetical protein GCM10010279_34660 [Streptomyces mutabilis]